MNILTISEDSDLRGRSAGFQLTIMVSGDNYIKMSFQKYVTWAGGCLSG